MLYRTLSTADSLERSGHPFHHVLFDHRASGGIAVIAESFDPNCPDCLKQAESDRGWLLWYTLAHTKTTRLVRFDEGREVAQRWAEDMAKDAEILDVCLQSPLGDLIRLKGSHQRDVK
jgi:hypothetical protein